MQYEQQLRQMARAAFNTRPLRQAIFNSPLKSENLVRTRRGLGQDRGITSLLLSQGHAS